MRNFICMITALFFTCVASVANTNQVSSAAGKHPLPASVQKAMDQSKEINKLSKQIAKEMDSAKREALISDLLAKFKIYSEQMDKADQERLAKFDAQREKMVQKMTEARIARQQRIESFMQNIRNQQQGPPTANSK